jgi:hypothetical protein
MHRRKTGGGQCLRRKGNGKRLPHRSCRLFLVPRVNHSIYMGAPRKKFIHERKHPRHPGIGVLCRSVPAAVDLGAEIETDHVRVRLQSPGQFSHQELLCAPPELQCRLSEWAGDHFR